MASDTEVTSGVRSCTLLRDHSARDPISRIPRRISFHVVRFGMDHNRGSPIAEQRVAAFPKRHVLVFEAALYLAFRSDCEIVHVAGVMAFGIFQAVLLVLRIKVRAR